SGLDFPAVHRARRIGELVPNPSRLLEQLCLQGRQSGYRLVRTLARKARRHRRLVDICRRTDRALDEAGTALLVEIRAGPEPCLEGLAPVTRGFAAWKIEHDHKVTGSGMGRRCVSAGIRERTSEMRLRSISAKPTPGCSPMSSKTSPHGSTTRLCPNVLRPS